MPGRAKPRQDNWLPRAKTAALVLLVFFVLGIRTAFTVPAHAQQGVAVGPYWQVEVEGDLTALAVDDLDGDHWAEVITGTDEGRVTLWRAEGEPAWTFDVETDWVTGLNTGDLEGDGAREVFVTAAGILPSNYLYVLGADGQLRWSHSVRDELWAVHLLDLDGDGRQEVLLAAQRPVALDDDGSELAGWQVGALHTPYVQVTDLDGDGAEEVIAVGETDVTILEADGTGRAWPHGLDDPVIAAQTADLDGDGQSEIIVATEKAVTLFHGDGELVWSHLIEEPPTAVRAEDSLGVLVASVGAVVRLTAEGDDAWRFVTGPSASLPSVHPGIVPSAASAVDVADPDADGTSEIVLGTARGQAYLLAPRVGGAPMAEYPAGGAVTLVRYYDLNGDGRGEVLVGAGGVLSVFGSPAGAATTRLRWAYATRGPVAGLAAGDADGDGRWEVAVGGREKRVTLLDKEGAMVWQFAAADIVAGMSASGSGEILVHAGSHLYLLAGDGSLLWQRTFDSPLRAVASAHGLVAGLVVGLEDGQVMLLDPQDGAERWSYAFDQPVQAVSVSEGLPGIVVGLGDGRVTWLDDQGRLLWEQEIGRFVSWLAVADVDHDGREDVIARSGDNVFRLQGGDGTVVWRTDTSAERLIGAALGDGVVVATDQRVFQLDATGAEAWSYPLDEVASAVYTAKLDGERGPVEVAVGTVKGGVYVLGADGQLLWQGKGRERVNALHAADLNGDGRQELLVAMEDGVVQAYGLAVNQVPWLSTPRVTPVGGGYVYSVQVRDPEGDDVQVALEIWDPSTRSWRAQEKSTAQGGKGTLSWNLPNPFDTWDAGRDSRFRFSWDDGQSQGTVAAVLGPLEIPVAPWYVFYGRYVLALVVVGAIPTLLLLVVRRARAYRRSPVGQAEAYLLRLTLEPEVLLPELHRLVSDEMQSMTFLPHLPGLARQAGDELIAGLAEGYYLILTRPEALGVTEGVRTIVSALAGEDRVPPVDWKREAQQVYEVLLAALRADSVPHIVALTGRLGSLEGLSGDPDFFLADTAQLTVKLGQVSRMLSKLELVESNADQIAYLAEAMEVLGQCDRQARSALVRPEQSILAHIVADWLPLITGALTGLQGRADLTIALRTRRVVTAGKEVVLVLALSNVGRGSASDLVVELLPGTGYMVHDGLAEVPVLPAGRSADVELRARPSPSVDAFRAEFRVTYDDRERAGKTELFADRVRLVAPPTVFRPIPNPYATGKPLGAGSPVFFGREDVFAFIRENLAGRAGENVLILVGERRMGKTSILRQLQLRLGEAIIPVFIDGQGVGMEPGMANLLYDISLEVQRSLAENGVKVELPPLVDFEARPTHAFERRLLAETRVALGDRTLLFLFDEFEELEARVRSGDLEEKVFAYLRHLTQHLEEVGFIFAGTHRLEELTADYWSTLFNIALYKRVGLLDENAARRLISEPVSDYGLVYDDLALDKMLKATAGHPYFLQLLCHTLVNIHNRERINYAAVGDVNRALDEMLELGEVHLAFLWERAAPRERAILAVLAHLVSAGEVGTAAAVTSLLADYGLETDPAEVEQTMQRLAAQELLREAGEGRARYEFRIDLVRLWIEHFRSLTQTVQAYRPLNHLSGRSPEQPEKSV
jgi:outer membrane protein assembly factor BamB